MPRLVRLLAALLLSVSAAGAQSLVVESASPEDYASGVPLATEVSFTFSEPLVDISQGFGTAPTLVALPTEAVEITETRQSDDGRTVTYGVTLQPDTRYVFLLLDAEASGGGRLARPFALNLTTAPSSGSFTVRGTVNDASGTSLDGTIVALVGGDLATGDISFAAATVLDGESGDYAVGPAPLGLYTVGAVRLPFEAGGLAPEALAFGFYDRNGDGAPDPVFSTSGIDVSIAPPDPITAEEQVESARSTASGEIADPQLLAISGPIVGDDGRASLWRYTFGDAEAIEKVDVVQVGPFALPLPNVDDVAGVPALPVPFVDSDTALDAAEASGGAAFRAANAGRIVSVSMRTNARLDDAEPPLWIVDYAAREAQDGPAVDNLTVEVGFVPTAASPSPEAPGVALRLASANPTSGALRVAVTLPTATSFSLGVFDARGRLVQRLHTGEAVAGDHVFAADLAPSLASGVYTIRLATPEAARSRTFVLSR